ncbi:MAG: hypothetical protein KTR16_06485 [Acidiferrobacterales bacterium]|nr:hypothetical protein [Acidiferrobacterales bacterium]
MLKAKHRLFCFITIFLCFCCKAVSATTITGTLSLPSGKVASGGMLVNISATDTTGGESFVFDNYSILSGESQVSYSLDVADNPKATWRIRYSCFDNNVACRDFVLTGYYDTFSSGNVSYKESDATTVAQGSSAVNFEFLEGVVFSGSLTSPSGPAPNGDYDTQIYITSSDFSVSESIRYSILEGDTSFDFSIAMPQDGALQYRVRYQCDPTTSSSGECSDLHLENGYYQSSAATNTVPASAQAELFSGNSSQSNLHMQLLPGASISGLVSRIAGSSNANPVTFSISAIDQTGGSSNAFSTIEIPAGSDSIPYSVVTDPNPASNWRLRIFCNAFVTSVGCSDYGQFSYYDADTPVTFTTANVNEADTLAGNTIHADINLTPVQAKFISGIVMLPVGYSAPVGGIDLTVTAQEFTGGVGGSSNSNIVINIPEGNISVAYSIPIAEISGAEWLLNVNCNDYATPTACLELAPSVTYYDLDNSPDFTTLDFNEADLLSSNSNITGINLTLIKADVVSGTITLGNERKAPATGLVVRMRAKGYLDGIQEAISFELVTIPPGENQMTYSIGLPTQDLDGWTLEIECDQSNPAADCSGFLPASYYAAGVTGNTTSEDLAQATLLDLSVPINNIDIELLSSTDELCVPIKAVNGNIALICL